MALINLQPGEVFTHAHDVVTTTVLVSGEIELTMDGETIQLTSKPTVVGAGVTHMLRNVGTTVATFACAGYGSGGEMS